VLPLVAGWEMSSGPGLGADAWLANDCADRLLAMLMAIGSAMRSLSTPLGAGVVVLCLFRAFMVWAFFRCRRITTDSDNQRFASRSYIRSLRPCPLGVVFNSPDWGVVTAFSSAAFEAFQ
jgi:hypothetical protein